MITVSHEVMREHLLRHPCKPRTMIALECPCKQTGVIMCWNCVTVMFGCRQDEEECEHLRELHNTVEYCFPGWRPVPRSEVEEKAAA